MNFYSPKEQMDAGMDTTILMLNMTGSIVEFEKKLIIFEKFMIMSKELKDLSKYKEHSYCRRRY